MKCSGLDSEQSWKVMAASLVIKCLSYGLTEISGLFMVASMFRYDSTREKASLPYTLIYCIRNGIGPLIAYTSHIIGSRSTTLLGCIVSSVAIGACFFAESILTVTILWGIVFGIGFAFETLLLNAIIIEHFEKHTAKATGISAVGIQIGIIIFSPLLEYLINIFGLSGAFLIISGLTLNSIPAALFIILNQPEGYQKTNAITRQTEIGGQIVYVGKLDIKRDTFSLEHVDFRDGKKLRSEVSVQNLYENMSPTRCAPPLYIKNACGDNLSEKDINASKGNKSIRSPRNLTTLEKYQPEQKAPPTLRTIKDEHNQLGDKTARGTEIMQFNTFKSNNELSCFSESLACKSVEQSKSKNILIRLFSEPVYLLILISGGVFYFSIPAFLTILVDNAVDTGIDMSYAKYILVWLSIWDFAGNVFLGYITDGEYMTCNGFASMCFMSICLAMISIVWIKNYISLALMIAIYQLSIAGLTLNYSSVVLESFEKDLRSPAIASMFILAAPLALVISPLIGSISYLKRDYLYNELILFTLEIRK